VRILSETGSGRAITFDDRHSPSHRGHEISDWLSEVVSNGAHKYLTAQPERLTPYSVRALTSKLAKVFDRAVMTNELEVDKQPRHGKGLLRLMSETNKSSTVVRK
jgi:hypothetical protein